MKKLLAFIFILAFAIAGYSQNVPFEYVRTSTAQFGKFMKSPIVVYLADSTKLYLLTSDYTRYNTMRNVFTDNNYVQVTSGSDAETLIAGLDSTVTVHDSLITINISDISDLDSASTVHQGLISEVDSAADSHYDGLILLNSRAIHDVYKIDDLYTVIKYPLMTTVVWDFDVDGGVLDTTALYGDTAFIPADAIITKVIQDIIIPPNSAGDAGTLKFIIDPEGDLTREVLADSAATGVSLGIPSTFALDGNAMSDTLMADSIATSYIKTTAQRGIDMVVGTEAITSGKIRLFIFYIHSETYSAP
jgi:hypothetical protein